MISFQRGSEGQVQRGGERLFDNIVRVHPCLVVSRVTKLVTKPRNASEFGCLERLCICGQMGVWPASIIG